MIKQVRQDRQSMGEKDELRRIRLIVFSGFLIATGIEYLYPFVVPLTIEIVPQSLFLQTYSGIGIFPTVMFVYLIYYLEQSSRRLVKNLHPTLDVAGYLQEVSRIVKFYLIFRTLIYIVTMTSFFLYHWFVLLPRGITDFNDPIKSLYVIVSGLGPLCVTLSFVKIWYDHHLGKLLGQYLSERGFEFIEQTKTIKRYRMATDTIVPILAITSGIFLIATSLILLEIGRIPPITWMWMVIFGGYLFAIIIIQYLSFYKPLETLHENFQDLVSGKVDWMKTVPIESTHELGDIVRMYNILIGRIQRSIALVVHSSKVITTQIDYLTTHFQESLRQAELIKNHSENSLQAAAEQKKSVDRTSEHLEKLISSLTESVNTIQDISSEIENSLDSLRILALNAELESSRLQQPSIYLLAENVNAISNEIQNVNQRTVEALQALEETVSDVVAKAKAQANTILNVTERTQQLSVQLEQEITAQQQRLNNLKVKVDLLKEAQHSLQKAIDLLTART